MKRYFPAPAAFLLLAVSLSGCYWYGGDHGDYGRPGYGGGPESNYNHPNGGPEFGLQPSKRWAKSWPRQRRLQSPRVLDRHFPDSQPLGPFREVDRLIYWKLPLWVFTIIYSTVFLYAVPLLVLVPLDGRHYSFRH